MTSPRERHLASKDHQPGGGRLLAMNRCSEAPLDERPLLSHREAHPGPPVAPEPGPDYGLLRWLVLATFIVILNETVMINAIPRLMADFTVTARTAQWLSTAFMLMMVVVIPVTGWFLARVTTRVAFRTAMTVFCVGTLGCATAPSFELLLAGRVVQAMGTAVMMPLLMSTLMVVVPEHDRGRVMGNVTLAISVAPALGPTVSGVILGLGSWRWIFAMVLLLAAAITMVALRRLRDVGQTRAGSIDWPSVALVGLGFAPLVYGLSQLGVDAPVSPVVMMSVGAATILLFVARQLRLQRIGAPLLDLRTLTYPTYALAITLMSAAFMAMIGSMIILPLYLQQVLGLSGLQTGLLVMPGGLAMGLLGPRVGRAYDAHGGRRLVIPGAFGMLLALGSLTQVGATTSPGRVLASHLLLMVSLATVFTPVFTTGLGALPPTLYTHGSSLLSTCQQLAAAIGTALAVTAMSWRSTGLARDGLSTTDALAGGIQGAFGVSTVAAVTAFVLAVLLFGRRRHQRAGDRL